MIDMLRKRASILWESTMARQTKGRIKDSKTKWERALIAAQLSAYAYKSAGPAVSAAKKLGFTWAKLLSKGDAEVLIAKDRTDMFFAFRGTEPSKLNDVLADLKVMQQTALAGGKVHSGFKEEVDDLWMDILAELESNDQLKVRKDVYFCGHSLGAAMATIATTRYSKTEELFTFGSPRVGGPKFIKNVTVPHMRFQNNNDIITRIPPAWLGYRHHGAMIYFNSDGVVAPKATWKDLFRGIINSWKRFKFFDGIVDHGIPNYVFAIKKIIKSENKK